MKTRRDKAHLIIYILPLLLIVGTICCGIKFSHAEEGQIGDIEESSEVIEEGQEKLQNLDEIENTIGEIDNNQDIQGTQEGLDIQGTQEAQGTQEGQAGQEGWENWESWEDAENWEGWESIVPSEELPPIIEQEPNYFNNTIDRPVINGRMITEEQQSIVIEKAEEWGMFEGGTYSQVNGDKNSVYYEFNGPQYVVTGGVGLVCKNKDQKPGGPIPMPYCLNYEINICSSGWLDSGKPTFTKTGGEIEPIGGVIPPHWRNLTLSNEPISSSCYFSARASKFPNVSISRLGQRVVFDYHVETLPLEKFVEVYNTLYPLDEENKDIENNIPENNELVEDVKIEEPKEEETDEEIPEIPNTGFVGQLQSTPELSVSILLGTIVTSTLLIAMKRRF